MTTPATPSAAPTAASTAPATSSSGASSSTPAPMSTAQFKQSIMGKPTPKPTPAPAPSPEPDVDLAASNYDSDVVDDTSFETESFGEEPALDAEETPVETDWSWAEPFANYREGVHGLPAAELLQALAEGSIPEAIMDKLTLTMKDGDEEWTGTVADLRNSAQMHKNFTKKTTELSRERKQFEAERGELVDYLRSWREDAGKGLAGLEKMLGEESVMQIAQRLAQRLARKEQLEALEAEGKIAPGTAAAVLQNEKLQQEVEEARRLRARHEEAATEQQIAERGTADGKRIQNEALTQFKLAGITQENQKLTKGMWNLFKEELQAIWPADRAPNPTEIRTAVMAAKQRADEYVREFQAKQPKPNKPAVTGSAPQAAPGAPKKAAAAPKTKSMSTAEFRKQMMGNSFGRR